MTLACVALAKVPETTEATVATLVVLPRVCTRAESPSHSQMGCVGLSSYQFGLSHLHSLFVPSLRWDRPKLGVGYMAMESNKANRLYVG